MPDPSTSLRDTRGGVDTAALYQRLFTGAVPYAEWAGRVRHGALLDVQRIDSAIRAADVGIMWPLADMAREAIALNPKAQGILGKGLLPLGNAAHEITAAEDGLSPQEREEAKKIADTIRAMLRGVRRFRQALLDLAFGFWDGRAALEVQYERRGSQSWPVAIDWMIPQRLSYDEARRLIVVDRWGDYGLFRRRGPALEDIPGKFIQFMPRMFADLQEREGLAPRFLYWLLFDRFGWRHRLLLTEAFGMPWMFVEQEVANTIGTMKLPRGDGGEGGAPTDDGAALDYTLAEAEATKREGKWVGLPGQKARLEWPPAEVNDFFTQGTDQIMDRLSWLACHNGINEGSRAAEVVLKAPEDELFEFRAGLVAEPIQQGLVDVLVELNYGADALPLAPSFRLRTKPERDRDKEVERLTKVSAAVPVGVSTWYEVSGFPPPQEGEKLATPPTPAGAPFGSGGGLPGGAAPSSEKSPPPVLPRGEGASEDAEGALRELLEDAGEDDQADAADAEADGRRLARWFAAEGRKVQPASANGSPEVIIERGVREGTRLIAPWTDALLDAADGTSPDRIYRNLARAMKAVDVEPFARAIERRLAHGLMLGGVDADHEMRDEVVIAPPAFSFAGGIDDFSTKPFGEAVKLFRSKNVVTRKTFDRMLASAKQRAFTVAGLTSKAMLQTAHAELARALEAGSDLRDFRAALSDRFDAAGWTQPNPSHVENVFRTNVMGAYGDGRRAQMTQPSVLAARPYWQILGVSDARTRPTHKAAQGKVLPASDPFFDSSGPPFGFQCRCRLVSRSAKDLQRLGLVPTIGAQLRGLPDPGWQADAIAEPFVATESVPVAVERKPAVETPRKAVPLAELPVQPAPKSPAPPEGRDAYKAHQEAQFAKLAPAEREAVVQFTNGYDWTIRELDKGRPDAEILEGIEAHRAKNVEGRVYTDTPAEHLAKAKKAREGLYSAFDKMDPVSERTVLRGLRGLDRATFDAIRAADTIDLGAVSSSTWDVNSANGFAGLYDAEEGHGVLFSLKTRSAYAIEEISEFPEERELLLKKGTRFRITKVYRPDIAPDRVVVIEAEEL